MAGECQHTQPDKRVGVARRAGSRLFQGSLSTTVVLRIGGFTDVLEIRVTKPGYIGKDTVIVIRRGAPPRRSDRCLVADTQRVAKCPPT